MPITELRSYRVTCDGCGAHGGVWNERVSPVEAVPDGWQHRMVDAQINGGWFHEVEHAVYCPMCAEAVRRE